MSNFFKWKKIPHTHLSPSKQHMAYPANSQIFGQTTIWNYPKVLQECRFLLEPRKHKSRILGMENIPHTHPYIHTGKSETHATLICLYPVCKPPQTRSQTLNHFSIPQELTCRQVTQCARPSADSQTLRNSWECGRGEREDSKWMPVRENSRQSKKVHK